MKPEGPWNPGVESPIPPELRHLGTVFRPENVLTDYARVRELRDFTGLDESELVAFRPDRLALHEVLVRVTADMSVPDGPRIGELGINFRKIIVTILLRTVHPRTHEIAVYS